MRALYWPLFALLTAVARSVVQRDGLRRAQQDLREPINVHTAVHPAEAGAIRYARLPSDDWLDRPAAAWLACRVALSRQVVLDTVQDHSELLAPRHDTRRDPLAPEKPMAIGHLMIRFDQNRPSTTQAARWRDSSEY